MSKDELKTAYLNTVYSIYLNESIYDVEIDIPVPNGVCDFLKNKKNHTGYILTAWNPRSLNFSQDENTIRNQALKTELIDLGCVFFDAVGTGKDSGWSPEKSFFISGLNDNQIGRLAVKFRQNAYVKIDVEQPASLVFSEVWTE